jgi:hypothetical protein
MPAVSTMLPAGYGRKVRAEWTIAPDTPGSVTNIFPIEDIGRANEWGSSLGGLTISMGNNILLASDGMRFFVNPTQTGGAQLLTALANSGDQYVELEIPNGETYVLSPNWIAEAKTYIVWLDSGVGATIRKVSDGLVQDFSDSVRADANDANLCIVRVKELPI